MEARLSDAESDEKEMYVDGDVEEEGEKAGSGDRREEIAQCETEPEEEVPVVQNEHWVQCDLCQKWRFMTAEDLARIESGGGEWYW